MEFCCVQQNRDLPTSLGTIRMIAASRKMPAFTNFLKNFIENSNHPFYLQFYYFSGVRRTLRHFSNNFFINFKNLQKKTEFRCVQQNRDSPTSLGTDEWIIRMIAASREMTNFSQTHIKNSNHPFHLQFFYFNEKNAFFSNCHNWDGEFGNMRARGIFLPVKITRERAKTNKTTIREKWRYEIFHRSRFFSFFHNTRLRLFVEGIENLIWYRIEILTAYLTTEPRNSRHQSNFSCQ